MLTTYTLEEWGSVTISDEALDRAIDIYSTNRRLLRQVYELRRADSLPIPGAEAMEMVLASMMMDKVDKLERRSDSSRQGGELMGFEFIILEKKEQIATLTLNRPGKKNPLNYKMLQEIIVAVDDVSKDSDTRVMVLTGAGDAFSAGADLKFDELRAGTIHPRLAEEMWIRINEEGFPPGQLLTIAHQAIADVRQLQKPVIAMIRGEVIGGGFGLALACDMRVCAEGARFMMGHPRIGFVPDLEESWVLPRIVGLGKALEIIMASEFVPADEAYRIGLVNRLVPAEKLEEETMKLAQSLIRIPPITQRMIKQTVYAGLNSDLNTSVLLSLACNGIIMRSGDHHEATMALAERRVPQYRDKNLLFEEVGQMNPSIPD